VTEERQRTLIVAHRGASADAPENTMEAYRLAVEQGADAIELDVHLSQDGQVVVIHDETVDRTTDGAGGVAGFNVDGLRAFDAGAQFAGTDGSYPFRDKGLQVPTLREVVEWLPDGVGLVVEIKARQAVDATIETLSDSEVRKGGRATVISFDEASIDRARELDSEIRTGYLLVPSQPFEPALTWAVEHSHPLVHPWDGDLGLDPAPKLAQALAYGRLVGTYVVNDPERMQQLAAYGLWAFVTDVPGKAREALGPATRG
jgi:glycerophosphoryl diester phosphodiesterase